MRQRNSLGLFGIVSTLGLGLISTGIACGSSDSSNNPIDTTGSTGGTGGSSSTFGGNNGSGAFSGAGGTTQTAGGNGGTTQTAGGNGGESAIGGSGGAGGAPVAQGQIRIAHLANAPAVQVCARMHSASATAPFSIALTKTLGSLANGLSSMQVTNYITVPAGQYDIRIVPAATNDCTQAGVVPDATNLPILNTGDMVTVVASGQLDTTTPANTTFQLKAFEDQKGPMSATASLRFIHAAKGTSAAPVANVDIGVYSSVLGDTSGAFVKMFPNVAYGQTGGAITTPIPVDATGYAQLSVDVARTSPVEIRFAETGAYFETIPLPIAIPKGTVATLFAYSKAGGTGVGVLACTDSTAGTNGLASCMDAPADETKKQPSAIVRLAHLSPDGTIPSVGVCLKPSSYPTWSNTKSQMLPFALTFPEVTRNLAERADSWDVRLVKSPSTSCAADANKVFDKMKVAVTPTTNVTLAASGIINIPPAGNAFDIRSFTNVDTAPEPTKSFVRFAHTLVDLPGAVDVGTATGTNQSTLWLNAAFGSVPATGNNITVSNGYLSTAPLASSTILGVATAASGGATMANYIAPIATAEPTGTAAGKVYTVWAIGNLANSNAGAFICNDSDATTAINPADAATVALSCTNVALAAPAHLNHRAHEG